MTVAVARPTWQSHLARLVDQITDQGDLRSPQWREALLAIPRHLFIPHYYVQDTSHRPTRWTRHEPGDAESTRRWLELVYSPTTLITELAQYADRGVQMPVCSSTKPDLMIRMLEALDVQDGHRVLEVGTGTGYNAALLTHRLGDQAVCSVDIDPALVAAAGQRLDQLGYHPTLVARDGAEGLPEHAPFDRIIATCSLRAVPTEWIHQLRPGGTALVHLEGPLGAGNLLALHRDPTQPRVQGRFLPWWGCFMARRTSAGPTTGTPRPTRTTDAATTRDTTLNPTQVDGNQMFPFLAQLHLPPGMYRAIYLTDDDTPVTYLASPDGSWCEINRQPDHTGRHTVREAGPTPLWAAIETAWTNGPNSEHPPGTSSDSPPPRPNTASGTATPTTVHTGHCHQTRSPYEQHDHIEEKAVAVGAAVHRWLCHDSGCSQLLHPVFPCGNRRGNSTWDWRD